MLAAVRSIGLYMLHQIKGCVYADRIHSSQESCGKLGQDGERGETLPCDEKLSLLLVFNLYTFTDRQVDGTSGGNQVGRAPQQVARAYHTTGRTTRVC